MTERPIISVLGCEFLRPFLEPYATITPQLHDAAFVLTANNGNPSYLTAMREARGAGRPLAWWTVEDPNGFETFFEESTLADYVFTSDAVCVPRYRRALGHDRVFWLPLACAPAFHYPAPLRGDAAEFVLSANWYDNEARRWGVETVVEPLRAAGRRLALFAYSNFNWPSAYAGCWRGAPHYLTVAEQYRHGAVVLGLNNQRTGLDGRGPTVMTSMGTFEALACGKPLLAAHSDAYARLGLGHGEHLASVRTPHDALEWGDRLLGERGRHVAEAGRRFVLEHHTYGCRLATIVKAIAGGGCDAPQEAFAMTYEEQIVETSARLDALPLDAGIRAAVRALAREHDNGNMRYPELLALAHAMLSFEWTPVQTACEIGTFHGLTAAFLGRIADLAPLPCHVVSIDSFESPYLERLPAPAEPYVATLARHGLLPRRNALIPMRSASAASYVAEGIGLLLVDGGHDYDGCLEDLAAYVPKVERGGAIVMDDIWYDTVRRACDDFPWAAHGCTLELSLEKLAVYRRGGKRDGVPEAPAAHATAPASQESRHAQTSNPRERSAPAKPRSQTRAGKPERRNRSQK